LPPEEPTGPVLTLEGVVRRFGGLVAVDGVSLTLGPRRRLAVIGPNGAGKTTLFRLIAGDMAPSEGRVHLFGRDVTRMPAHRRARLGLSRTFQVTNLFGGLSVLDNVRLAVQARTSSRWRFLAPIRQDDQVGTAALEALERVGIGSRAHHRVADLSHGEQRQLEVAMALATEPRLLLLDEVMAGLNPTELGAMVDLIRRLHAEGLTLMVIEHVMAAMMRLAQRIVMLHHGEKIAEGTPRQIASDRRVIDAYLGEEFVLAEA
jgi:branched-chain amino acid transport system ATP-binding protein